MTNPEIAALIARRIPEMARDGIINNSEVIEAILRESRQTCHWDEDIDGNYETGCDGMFALIDGTPKQNHYTFCPRCGGRIVQ